MAVSQDREPKAWEEKFAVGQMVEYIDKSLYATVGQKGIVVKGQSGEFYKTHIKLLDSEGKFTGQTEIIYNTLVLNKVKAIDEKVVIDAEKEIEINEIRYVEEDEVVAKIKELKNYEYSTIKNLSLIELKVLISTLTAFHPKYIKDIEITDWENGTGKYQIDFSVEAFIYENAILIYEDGLFDLDFK